MRRSNMHLGFVLATLLLGAGLMGCEDEARCGNGSVESGEDCDGDRFAPVLVTGCQTLGYNGTGRLGCTPGCRIDPGPCEVTGRCGDGVVAAGWEECDGVNLLDQSCESLGHHGGVLRCTPDCRLDIGDCRRCGDGLLEPDEGELYEVGYQVCEENGFFGGYHHTEDCVIPGFSTCGEYRLISQDPPVSRPVLALGGEGRLWLSGLVRGSFGGPALQPECPVVLPYYTGHGDNCNTWSELDGYYLDSRCDRDFLAAIDGTDTTRVLSQPAEAGQVDMMFALADGGVATVRRIQVGSRIRIQVDGHDAAGALLASTPLGTWDPPTPIVKAQALADGRLAFTLERSRTLSTQVVDPYGLITVDHPFSLISLNHAGQEYTFETTMEGMEPWWESPTELSFVAKLQVNGVYPAPWHWVRIVRTEYDFELTHLFPMELHLNQHAFGLQVDPLAETLEVFWNEQGNALEQERRTWTGELLSLRRREMTGGRSFEAAFRTGEQGLVVAGTVYLEDPSSNHDATCAQRGMSYFVETLDADWALVSERTFSAPGLMWLNATGIAWCDDERSYVFDGHTVTVGATHVRYGPFCSPHEPSVVWDGLPFYVCDIHVVRLTP